MDYKNKVVIVTGAAKGIGAAIAGCFANSNARVALVDIDEVALTACCDELAKQGCNVKAHVGNILEQDFLNNLVTNIVEDWGHIDVLVNNAGIIRDNFVSRISEEDWDAVLDVNLKGAFLCVKAVLSQMKEQQYGKIVNIASRAWLGNVGQANYSASKGGLISLTRTLALELARFQINVNAVAPGLIDTPMTQKLPEEVRQRLIQLQPTKKIGSVDDIAQAVGFLASDHAQFITGQVLHVDGGKSCGLLSL